jgi:hypothetical protein
LSQSAAHGQANRHQNHPAVFRHSTRCELRQLALHRHFPPPPRPKAPEGWRTPRRFAPSAITANAPAFWTAAALRRFPKTSSAARNQNQPYKRHFYQNWRFLAVLACFIENPARKNEFSVR